MHGLQCETEYFSRVAQCRFRRLPAGLVHHSGPDVAEHSTVDLKHALAVWSAQSGSPE
jgi:hypothetical protein